MASRTRVVIAGGGVLGTMHAVMARRRGFEVVQLERGASAAASALGRSTWTATSPDN